jgi:hypothetical protein
MGKLLRVAFGVGACAVACAIVVYEEQAIKASCLRFLNLIGQRAGASYGIRPETYRSEFNALALTAMKPVKAHTHPDSAADRSTASAIMGHFACLVGLRAFYVQKSRADERNSRAGSRVPYWVKDLTAEPDVREPGDGDLVCLVDTDYYLDMPRELVRNFAPHLIYCFQPTDAAGSNSEFAYTFDKQGRLDYQVVGGARYVHRVWNYTEDNLKVVDSVYGVPIRVASYLVDRKTMANQHVLILLTPIMQWSWPWSILAWFLHGGRLERFQPVSNGFIRIASTTDRGMMMSTALVGHYSCATVPIAQDENLRIMASVTKLTTGMVDSHVDKVNTPIMYAYHTSKSACEPARMTVAPHVRRYQFGRHWDFQAKPTLKAFMAPLLDGAFAPDRCIANERNCVKERVTRMANTVIMTPKNLAKAREFVEILIPVAGLLSPVGVEEVYERQSRPSQRAILEEAGWLTAPKRILKVFLKREAYGNVKPPRPISQINGLDKRDYSRYTYALAEVIKACPWYAFGKTPAQVAQRVVQVCAYPTQTIVETDFSRFDGTVSPAVRDLERMVLMRAFKPEYHAELIELHRSQYGLPAITTLGVRYDVGTARASGSPETAIMNSIVNAFVAYLVFRTSADRWGRCPSPQGAYNRLGVYGGDDGLTGNVDQVRYEASAKSLGLKLTAAVHERGSRVKFLARVYGPYVWNGDPDSCCDLPRQLAKFHTTVCLPDNVPEAAKLAEKARSFLLTDRNTPVLGEFCVKVEKELGALPEPTKALYPMLRWNSELPVESQYPNTGEDWMEAYAQECLKPLNFDLQGFRDWLVRVPTLEALMHAPPFAPPIPVKAAEPTLVDGVLFEPEPAVAVKPAVPRRVATVEARPARGRGGYARGGRSDRTRRTRGRGR